MIKYVKENGTWQDPSTIIKLEQHRGWEIAPLSDVKLLNKKPENFSPIWPKNLKPGPIAPFELSDCEDEEDSNEPIERPILTRR